MGYCAQMKDSKFYVETQHTGLVYAMTKKSSYDLELDSKGNVVGITFKGVTIGKDYDMLQSIAPYVKSGSYIEMFGEDGARWRWEFKDGKCNQINAIVSWGKT